LNHGECKLEIADNHCLSWRFQAKEVLLNSILMYKGLSCMKVISRFLMTFFKWFIFGVLVRLKVVAFILWQSCKRRLVLSELDYWLYQYAKTDLGTGRFPSTLCLQ
jgi:hypothetical protein